MHVQLHMDEPLSNVILWEFHGLFGMMDYMPPMNDSISRAMVEPDTRYDALLDMGWAVPLPNRPFRYITQAINGAPPNFQRVVCACKNPLTRAVIGATLGREASLQGRFIVTGTLEDAVETLRGDRNASL